MIGAVPRLLERAAELHRLHSAVDRAAAGRGTTVLVTGEPGIGKTSLLQAFVAELETRTRVLAGVCEDLLTPRALGALWDIPRTRPGPLATALAARANPDLLLAAVTEELARLPAPTVLIIEDAHWADGATLDALRHVTRRISELPAVLILTYRDAEVGVITHCGACWAGWPGLRACRSARSALQASITAARQLNNHEYVMRGYYNLVEGLWRLRRYDEASDYMHLAREYSQDRGLPVHSYMLDARRFRLMAMRGRRPEAIAGLRSLLDGQDDPGMIGRETLPVLARLLVRQGHPDATQILAAAVEHAERADVLGWLVPTGLAWIERAWLTGRPEQASRFRSLLDRTDRPGSSVQRGELLRFLRRLGYPSRPFRGCPAAYAGGLRGDWQTAATAWERAGNRYEQALELADSGEQVPTLEALQLLLDWVRSRPRLSCAAGCGRLALPRFHVGGPSEASAIPLVSQTVRSRSSGC
jgi:AAA ATPase domain